MPRLARLALLVAALCSLVAAAPALARDPAPTPPMGWNSWDAYGFTLDEAQFKANAEVLSRLAPLGWTYAVIDEGWYMADPFADKLETRKYLVDGHGRLAPVPARFPSAADGRGFKTLADWTHARGLKFGVHIVRGIPKAAVAADAPIAGSAYRASAAADKAATCPWDDGNWGVADNAAGQAWYDSLLAQYAAWGVDFLKVDCIADHPYRESEIRQIARAIRKTGRPIVLSLSPGPAQVANVAELSANSQMWRIADDLWDGWTFPRTPGTDFPNGLRSAFDNLARWNPHVRPGNWPDADMLPLGVLKPHPGWGEPRVSRLTADEARTMVTLWAIARSPMIVGGDLTRLDPALRDLLGDREVIALNQRPGSSRPVATLPPGFEALRAWVSTPAGAAAPDTVAIFNLADAPARLRLRWRDLGFAEGSHSARDLWDGAVPAPADTVELALPPHGAAVFKVQ